MGKAENPWKGLKSYREGEVIYGRDTEIESLSQYIINNTQTVLYGKSGIGKSSILNAGIFPLVRRLGLYPVPVRLKHGKDYDYVAQLYRVVSDAGLDRQELVPVRDVSTESLWEFFHRQRFVIKGSLEQVHPLFVFDQFEEIFTLQRIEKNKLAFFSQLGDLLNDICPLYQDEEKPSIESGMGQEKRGEDDFSFDLEDGKTFVTSDYIDYPQYHFVFALREDFLSSLERYTSYIPVMKRNRFSLQPINEEQAQKIIMEPIPGLVSMDVAEHIIRKVTGRSDFSLDGIPEIEVDSAVLSLYLSRLFEKKDGDLPITFELVDKFGNDIIQEYYEDSISGICTETVDLLEKELLTLDGRRDNKSRTDLQRLGVPPNVLDLLIEDKKLLRQFSYGDDMRVELIHDILCPVVQKHVRDKELESLKREQQEREIARHQENRRRNQSRAQNDLNVLTARGRSLIDNRLDFGSFFDRFERSVVPIDSFVSMIEGQTSIDFDLRYLYHDEVDFSGLGGIAGIEKGKSFTTGIEFRDSSNAIVSTLDGIGKLRLFLEDNRICEIFFLKCMEGADGQVDIPLYLNGYCGIRIRHDQQGREVRRMYLDEDSHPAQTRDGYYGVARYYDDYGNIEKVQFLDGDGNPCPHLDGSYGYRSEYDSDGLEIRRVFIGREGAPFAIPTGIFGRDFTYDEQGRLSSERNLGAQLEPMTDSKGFMAVHYEYDEHSRMSKETYLDFSGNPVLVGDLVYAITNYHYEEDEQGRIVAIEEMYADLSNNIVAELGGSVGNRYALDEHLRMIEFGEYHENNSYLLLARIERSDEGTPSRIEFHNIDDREDAGGTWVLYDKNNRYVSQYGMLDKNGAKVQDTGAYGHEIERDQRTMLPIAEVALDRYNQKTSDDDGVCRRRYIKVSEKGEILQEKYEDLEGNPQADSAGNYGKLYDYDEEGNLVQTTYLGTDGKPAPLPGSEVVYKRCKYNSSGQVISEHFYDLFNRKTPNDNGEYGILYDLDGSYYREISVGVNDNPVDNKDGFCKRESLKDKKGRAIRTCYLTVGGSYLQTEGYAITETEYDDSKNQKTQRFMDEYGVLKNNDDGIAFIRYSYDDAGREIQQMRYDKDGEAVIDSKGSCGNRTEYGQNGRSVTLTYLGPDETPVVTSAGYASIRTLYDSQGRKSEVFFYDEAGNPTNNGVGYGTRCIYSERGNVFTYINLDADGKPVKNLSDNYTAIQKTMDSQDRVVEEFYLDENLMPIECSSGCYGCRFHYEDGEEGRCRELCWLDRNGAPYEDEDGIAYELSIETEQEKILQWFDADHRPVTLFGYFKQVTVNQEGIETIRYFDLDGNRMNCTDGYAGIIRVYDEEGRQIRELLEDVEGALFVNSDGICGWEKAYLEDGRVLKTNLDEELNPTFDSDGRMTVLECYDEQGRIVSEVNLDEELHTIPCDDGWIRQDFQYDDDGNQIEVRYFDADGNPMSDTCGDYGLRDESNGQKRVELIAYLGPDAKPHMNRSGWCYDYRELDDQGRTIVEMGLDKHKAPVKRTDGSYGIATEYLEDGKVLLTCLDEDGNPQECDEGYSSKIQLEDSQGRIVWFRTFDIHDKPVANSLGDYGSEVVFSEDGDEKIEYGLDAEGNRHYDKNGVYAFLVKTIDIHHYTKSYLNENNQLVADEDGIAKTEIWEDEKGRIIRELFYASNGSLYSDENGVCGKEYVYLEDASGSTVRRYAELDLSGKPIVDCGRMYYQEYRGSSEMTMRWFDKDMHPVKDRLGAYGRLLHVLSNNVSVMTDLDKEGNPCNNLDGYCTEIVITDEAGSDKSVYLDIDGNFVNAASRLGRKLFRRFGR